MSRVWWAGWLNGRGFLQGGNAGGFVQKPLNRGPWPKGEHGLESPHHRRQSSCGSPYLHVTGHRHLSHRWSGVAAAVLSVRPIDGAAITPGPWRCRWLKSKGGQENGRLRKRANTPSGRPSSLIAPSPRPHWTTFANSDEFLLGHIGLPSCDPREQSVSHPVLLALLGENLAGARRDGAMFRLAPAFFMMRV